jgi:hypothetical protein
MKTPHVDPQKLKEAPVPVINKFVEKRESVFSRFPLLFTFLGTFGAIATFYGAEHVIDKIDVLAKNPFLLLSIGIITLAITGTLYKKLD